LEEDHALPLDLHVAHHHAVATHHPLELDFLDAHEDPAGPEDAVGRGISEVGCRLESFLAPVEPGNLLLLAYAGEIPVVAAPGCFRSPKPNVVDLVLPPLLARYPLSAAEISTLGHGGLL
jgi:molybdenum cofactor cytidylyltransferase